MEDKGEIDQIFMQDIHSPVRFFALFTQPQELYFEADTDGIYLAAWYQPWLNGTIQSMYMREDVRHSPKVAKMWFRLINRVFEVYPVILGVTKQQHILDMHLRLGYSVSTVVPDLFGDQEHGWIVSLHKNDYKFKTLKEKSDSEELREDVSGRAEGVEQETLS